MMRYILLIAVLFQCSIAARAQLQSPQQFFKGRYSQYFTGYAGVMSYIRHLEANSDRIRWQSYGSSNEGRELGVCIISTPGNLQQAEAIRSNHLAKAGLAKAVGNQADNISIVWISHGVHGNEAGSTESAIQTLYDLVNPDNVNTGEWLRQAIVILDPAINPDGYDRYCNWNNMAGNSIVQPDPQSREHDEPWPGGRTNHYYFDLNRDWAWQTQAESRQRLALYRQWMPVIHADIHEMFPDNSYYFAPAAEPFHTYITPWQREFQQLAGRNHAKYFDAHKWLYFTGEVFDLLYPSYGDTYPIFNGAIGMTYEQAGHAMAGRAILTSNGDTLTLLDRIQHHNTAVLSTLEITSLHAQKLNSEFARYFQDAAARPKGSYQAYLVKGAAGSDRMKTLRSLLDRNGIRYGSASGKADIAEAFSYMSGKTASVKAETGDLVIPAAQPMSTLLQVLFEPDVILNDSLTYDITAWAIPYAYGLDCYASRKPIAYKAFEDVPADAPQSADEPYAFCIPWTDLGAAKTLSRLYQAGIQVRSAAKPLTIAGENVAAGALVITAADHRKKADWFELVYTILRETDCPYFALQSGWLDQGPNIGSDYLRLIPAPALALIGGEQSSENAFGHLWHYMEQVLEYPLSVLDAKQLANYDLDKYQVLLLTDGRYDIKPEILEAWVKKGGRLILVGSANEWAVGKQGFSLELKEGENGGGQDSLKTAPSLDVYLDSERKGLSDALNGAAIQAQVDDTHPLGYGLGKNTFVLKTTPRLYNIKAGLTAVGSTGKAPRSSGFIGANVKADLPESLLFGIESAGAGKIIYLTDEPVFRGFWYQGAFLMANAIFRAR